MPSKTPSIALGAVVNAVLAIAGTLVSQRLGITGQSVLFFASCLLLLAGPVVAVWHYTSTHRLTVLPGAGAGMGALAAGIGALVSGIITQVLVLLNLSPDVAETLAIQRQKMIAEGMDPAQLDQIMNSGTSGGILSNPIVGILIGVLVAAAFGAIAGAVGAAIFKKGPIEPGAIESRRA